MKDKTSTTVVKEKKLEFIKFLPSITPSVWDLWLMEMIRNCPWDERWMYEDKQEELRKKGY
jgi:hypothetical protein